MTSAPEELFKRYRRSFDPDLLGEIRAINGIGHDHHGQPYLNLLVMARHYMPAKVCDVRDDRMVVLHPFPKIQVKFASGLEALPESHRR